MPETKHKATTKKPPLVKLQGSPLARFTGTDDQLAENAAQQTKRPEPAQQPPAAANAPQNGAESAQEGDSATANVPAAAKPKPKAAPRRTAKPSATGIELAPPALNENTARLAVDLPESLVSSFMAMAERLRNAEGRRASQKVLPNREVMAALIWDALGDPSSDEAVKRMDGRLRRYRAKQLEQAAAAAAADVD